MSESEHPMDLGMVDEYSNEVRKHGSMHVEGLACMACIDEPDSFLSEERVTSR